MRALAKAAAALYPARDRFARHFAVGKLTGDPAFEHLLRTGLVPPDARLLDLGCGQALLAALLRVARERHAAGDWPTDWPPPPRLAAFHGIELKARDVARANGVVPGATRQGDIRDTPFPAADAVVILDVLHYIDPAAQAAVLRRVRDALAGGGVLLLRVGDAAPTWRFRYTVAVDRLVMALRGHGLVRLHCRPLAQWIAALEALGFRVEARPMSRGTAFANVLLVARYDSR